MQQQENKKIWNAIFKATLAFILTAAVGAGSFFAGYYVRERRMSKEIRTLDWVISMVKRCYYTDFTSEEIIDAATAGIETLLDPYSSYFSAEEYAAFNSSQQGYRAGIGVTYAVNAQSQAVIYRVYGGSPAEAAGFCKNEVVKGMRLADGTDPFTLTPTYTDFTRVLASYPENTPIDFLMGHNGEDVVRQAQKAQFRQKTTFYYTKAEIPSLPQNAAYIRFDTFTGTAKEDFAAAMERYKAEGKTQLILDLRDNGGGSVAILCDLASYLLKSENGKQNVVMKAQYKTYTDDSFRSTPSVYEDYTFNAVKVLINGNSASASEALVGAMLDYGTITLNDVYGMTSYGKGIMQTTYSHTLNKDAIKLTTARIVWPISDTCIQGVGIVPGHGVQDLSSKAYTFETDAQLMCAVESLAKDAATPVN